MRKLHGIGISPGRGFGKARFSHRAVLEVPDVCLTDEQIPEEILRLEQALSCAVQQLEALRGETSLGEAYGAILDFHQLALSDPELVERTRAVMEQNHCGLEHAFQKSIDSYVTQLLESDSEYMRARSADIHDIGIRVLKVLLGKKEQDEGQCLGEPSILLAEDMPPSEAARLNPRWVKGVLLSCGSPTSHTAILAKALGIPAVVIPAKELASISEGTEIGLNGGRGDIVLEPTEAEKADYAESHQENPAGWRVDCHAVTLDGVKIELLGNVELPVEALTLKRKYQVGIGLFRTEFLFVERGRLLSEEEQYDIYQATARAVSPYEVTFRTLDIGGDKFISEYALPSELNPFLGTRAIRFSLQRKDIFRTQLRALLRVSAEFPIHVMFPMISTVGELKRARECVNQAMDELKGEGIPFDPEIKIGCMIEVPSAAILSNELVKDADFFSIGTNDLVQYCLAVDRGNSSVAHLYQPLNPAVLRLVHHVVTSAQKAGKPVSLCGEMAGDRRMTALLVGMGLRRLSMSPGSLSGIKESISAMRCSEVQTLAEKTLACGRTQEVEALLQAYGGDTCATR